MTCPKCVKGIPLYPGRLPTSCPHCGINFEQYSTSTPADAGSAQPTEQQAFESYEAPQEEYAPQQETLTAAEEPAGNVEPEYDEEEHIYERDEVEHDRSSPTYVAPAYSPPPQAAPVHEPPPVRIVVAAMCQKKYVCAACRCVYRTDHVVHGDAKFEHHARERAFEELEELLRDEPDRPCPTCGGIRPDQTINAQWKLHLWTWLFASASLSLLVGIGVFRTSSFVESWGICAALVAFAAALLHMAAMRFSPQRSTSGADSESEMHVHIISPGSNPEALDNLRPRLQHWVTILLMLLGPIAFLSPTILRKAKGWPINADYPPYIIGPGDVVTVPFRNSALTTMFGKYRAVANVEVLNASDFASEPTVFLSARQDDWEDTLDPIVAKLPNINVEIPTLTAQLRIPEEDLYSNKNISVRMYLDVRYPYFAGTYDAEKKVFPIETRTTTVQMDESFRLTSLRGGNDYRTAWLLGATIGTVTYVFGGLAFLVYLAPLRPRQKAIELIPIHV